ncbi:MAG: hypothetical protein ACO1RT_10235 [Planctomycetaceae bacterium]
MSQQSTESIERAANEFFASQTAIAKRNRTFSSTKKIVDAYSSGQMVGAVTDTPLLTPTLRKYARNCRDQARNIIGRSEYRFATASGTGSLHQDWKGKLCIPYIHYLALDPRLALLGAQLTGDCVSWSKRTMRDMARSFDIKAMRKAYEYVKRSATADLYSMRGHTDQGASPSRIAVAATKIGILLEAPITSPDGETWDFSDYKTYHKLGMKYGKTGFPKWIYEANEDKGPKQVAEVESIEELCTAIWNGNGTGVGSGIGVSKRGGKDGVAFLSALEGGWAHDMAIIAFDDRKKYHRETLIIWDQSWGEWQEKSLVQAWPADYGPRPQGAFVLTATDTMKAIRGGECHALSDSKGFRPRRHATMGAEGLI